MSAGQALFEPAILVDALVGMEVARSEIARTPRRWITRLGWAEILSGARGDAERVEEFLDFFQIVELTEQTARRAAELRAQRPSLALSDAINLASAQLGGLILITRNTRDFPAQMPGIRVPYTL